MSKASKHRSCPAVQREISSAECRENRVSRYACPASCAFNVLSPERYDDFILLERDVIYKAADRHLDTAPDRAAALREVERMANCPPAEQHAREISLMLFERDAQGRTLAGRWEAADFPGLSNDERVVFRALMRPRLRLVEVRRILDGLRTEVVDLFEAESRPFIMHDRSLTRQASRFACFIGWFYELPHLVRVSGVITQMPELGTFEPAEVMKEIIRHLGGPAEPQDFQEWFARNSLRYQAAMMATSLARREAMFRSMDAEFGKAVYELRAPFAECRARLDENSHVAPDALAEGERNEGFADARVWFDDAPVRAPATPEAQPALGRVLLGQAHWRLEALGTERLARLRGKFEQCFGERVRFTGERRDDMAAHLQSKEPKYDPTLVPPRLLEQPVLIHLTASRVALPPAGSAKEFIANFQEHEDHAWIENAVPALNNRTPREAAKDPALRPILIRLLKNRVRALDERNLREGTNHDLTWLLRELGADEMVTEPPPRRRPLHQAAEALPAALPNDDDFGAPDFDDPPPLPAEPFGREEAIRRVLIALQEYETAQDAMDAMEEAGGCLIEDAAEIVGDLLNETEFMLLSGYLTQLWFAFVPPGCWGPAVEYEDFRAAYGRQLHGLMPGANDKMEIAFEKSAQPSLIHAFALQILHAGEDLPQPNQVRDENRTLFLLVINAAIEVLDATLRNEFSPEPEPEAATEPAVINVSNEMKSNNQPTPVAGTYGSPLAPLLTRGQPSSQEISDDEYARLGLTHAQVPELIRMSLDEALNNGPGQSALVWAPVHAWRALAELRAVEAVVPLLGLLRRIDEAQDDWVSEQLPRVLGRIGPGAIGPIADYLANPAQGEWARVAAAQSLRWMGGEHPAARGDCVAALTRQLEQFADQSDTLNGSLTSTLMDLRAVESMPVMERAFASGRVDESVCGDYEDVEIELGLKTKREHPRKPNKMTMMGEKFRAQWAAAGLPLPDADGHFPKPADQDQTWEPLRPAHAQTFLAPPKTGRNDPCPCGSGKKFKKCCGA